ncbi:MAG: PaaI family thioesterase [Xanthobacteraceae bacterium]|nr:MAG: PaaI family thioesterase [Xanthobacteraceae bacterium]
MTRPQHASIGLVPAALPYRMTGLEILRAMMAGDIPSPPICQTLGFALTEVAEGHAVFSGQTSYGYLNPYGTVHGGYSAALLDSAMTCAVQSRVPAGFGLTTLEFKVSFVRGYVADTGMIRAVGTAINVGRRIGTSEGRLVDDRDRLLVHATSTCLIMDLPPAPQAAPQP